MRRLHIVVADGPYDPNDAAAVAAYWQQANIKRGRGRPTGAVKRPALNMRIDADVLEAFKATGQGWQTRINAALRQAVAHGFSKAQCLLKIVAQKKGQQTVTC